MVEAIVPERTGAVTLPSTAPKVRITAGLGTANQKTWNLRRPVTLIGTSRLAHIVLSDETVSRAHCLIVNTGRNVLLKDLHSTNGTCCNDRPADLVALTDGDVLRLGDTAIQVALQDSAADPGETNAGVAFDDPLTLVPPVVLRRTGGSECWTLDRAVNIIGSRPGVAVHLAHADVASVHAALVSIDGAPVLFDLGSPTGTWVNRHRDAAVVLQTGDQITVGPFDLEMTDGDAAPVSSPAREHLAERADTAEAQLVRLCELEAALHARADELSRRELQLAADRTAVEAARAVIENDRRALEQQASALWKAKTQLDGARNNPPPRPAAAGTEDRARVLVGKGQPYNGGFKREHAVEEGLRFANDPLRAVLGLPAH